MRFSNSDYDSDNEDINWNELVGDENILISTALANLKNIDWNEISMLPNLPESFIRRFYRSLNWNSISKYQNLSENLIMEFQQFVNWHYIGILPDLEFVRAFHDFMIFIYNFDYELISENRVMLTEEFIREFAHVINWDIVSSYYNYLSNEFIRDYQDKLNWNILSHDAILDWHIFDMFPERIAWDCLYEDLIGCEVEAFILKHEMKIDWDSARDRLEYCDLSDLFVVKFRQHLKPTTSAIELIKRQHSMLTFSKIDTIPQEIVDLITSFI